MYHKIINNFPVLQTYFSGIDKPANPQNTDSPKLHTLNRDTFEKSSVTESPALGELNRLFPNNEISQIYDDIVSEYGLENIPKLKFETNSNGGMDFASTSHVSNTVTLNLDNILTNHIYKFLVEKDGKKTYCINEKAQELRTLKTSNKEDINTIIDHYKHLGADNCTAEHLSDDDKRKLIIFSLAHELEHCYQNQLVRHTEGLDEFEMIKAGLQQNPNKPEMSGQVEETILEKLKEKYNDNYTASDFEKIYTKDSPEGKKALEWYNATINYTDYTKDYDTYVNNPLEVDANSRAHEYLTKKYGDFTIEVK